MQSEGDVRHPTSAQPSATTEVEAGVPIATAAGDALATWRRVDVALSPIIGPLGMAALFKRSLFLAGADQPALALAAAHEPGTDAYAHLRDVLTQQTEAAACVAQAALLHAFHDLLSSLIGASLTERLLRSAAAFPPSGDAAQDSTP